MWLIQYGTSFDKRCLASRVQGQVRENGSGETINRYLVVFVKITS